MRRGSKPLLTTIYALAAHRKTDWTLAISIYVGTRYGRLVCGSPIVRAVGNRYILKTEQEARNLGSKRDAIEFLKGQILYGGGIEPGKGQARTKTPLLFHAMLATHLVGVSV